MQFPDGSRIRNLLFNLWENQGRKILDNTEKNISYDVEVKIVNPIIHITEKNIINIIEKNIIDTFTKNKINKETILNAFK